jgi:membrane protein
MLQPLQTFARAVTEAPRYYLSALWRRLNDEPVFIWSQAIAFKVLITILPVILIATGVFGLILRQADPFETVADYLRQFLPPGQSEALIDLMFRIQQTSPALTIIGLVIFVIVVMTLFSVLRYVVGTSMGSGRHRYRSILHGYAFDVRMGLQVGLLFLLSFGLTLVFSYLTTTGQEFLVEWGLDPELLRRGERLLLHAASLILPFLLSLLMFWQLYYFIPRPRPPMSSAFFGAFFTAILFEVAKNAFTFYAAYLGQFQRYGTGDEALGGVFGLVIAFVLWVYFSGLVLIIGAMLTHLHELRHRPERQRMRSFARKFLFRKHHTARPHPTQRMEPDGGGDDTEGASQAAVPGQGERSPAPESNPAER